MTQNLDIALLPKIQIESREKLPKSCGLYFAIDESGNVLYIGIANGVQGFRGRWLNNAHHKLEKLLQNGCSHIAYWETQGNLEKIEYSLICQLNPPFNQCRLRKFESVKTSSLCDRDLNKEFGFS